MNYYRRVKKESTKGSSIEFSCKPGVLMAWEVINGGMENEQRVFRLKGKIKKNKPTVVATMKVSAAANKRFAKSPGLKRNLKNRKAREKNTLKTRLSSTIKDADNNIISYLYDVIYTAKQKQSKSSPLKYDLTTTAKDIITRVFGIDKINVGRDIIAKDGETKTITIMGDKDATFKLAICSFNELEGAGFDSHFIEESIIRGGNSSFSNHMGTIDIIDGKINSNGKYTVKQKFPVNEDGINKRYSVNLLPTIVKPTFTKMFEKGFYEKDRAGWGGWYTKILTQPLDPIITLKALFIDNTGGGKTVTINGVTTSGGGYAGYDKEYEGMYDMTATEIGTKGVTTAAGNGGGRLLHKFEVTYVCKTNSGAITIIDPAAPHFTHWTNSTDDSGNAIQDESKFNGNDLFIQTSSAPVLSTTSTSNDTCTFKVKVDVRKWGTENLTLTLDINTFLRIV